jgi:sulfur relay (sulfurtransferase) DsrF/TusC family protein
MKRIKTGELVELSAAGRKLDQNSEVYHLFGMVYEFVKGQHPYKIQWYNLDGTIKKFPMARYEIKRFKGAKCK